MARALHFTKMHGLGNDFMVIDNLDLSISIDALPVVHWANRHLGIGFDQLLILEPSDDADLFCRILNADGSEAEQCGNGLRCVARFAYEKQLVLQKAFTIETKAGIFPAVVKALDDIQVTLGKPVIEEASAQFKLLSNETIRGSILSMGNPQAVVSVRHIGAVAAYDVAQQISHDKRFPEGVNVGFMEIVDPQHVKLRTVERGAGETFACGSNACAAAVTGIVNGWLRTPVTVEYPHGTLVISWEGENLPVVMTGSASLVYQGQVMID